MKFCPECGSVLDISVRETLQYRCRICDYNEETTDNLVYERIYNREDTIRERKVSPYICFDNTLKRTKHKTCPNNACPTVAGNITSEAVMFDYDETRKIMYVCCICLTRWKEA